MQLRGADIITECLIEQGADVVFGYPGGAVLNIYDSLYNNRHRIKHYLTSHEQHAGHAADGYARATGKTGVVIATSGPGASNIVTAVATAQMDSVPLVAITGNVSTDLLGLDSFQEVDITGITMPVTKHNFVVRDVNRLAETLRRAFTVAREGRRGAVLVDIPKDITAAFAEYTPLTPGVSDCTDKVSVANAINAANPEKLNTKLERAIELIVAAERPFLYTGGGVISANCSKELAEFARIINAPVAASLMGQGGFDQTDPRYIGMLGMHGSKAAAETIRNCDLFIALGTRFSDRVIGDKNTFAENAKVIHIDIDEVEHGKNIDAYLQIAGDLKAVLFLLNTKLKRDLIGGHFSRAKNQWVHSAEMLYSQYKGGGSTDQKGTEARPVTPQAIMERLWEVTCGDAVITTEVGQSQMWAAQYFKYRYPRSFITSGGLGTMGYGLGAAIGAKVGCPDKVVVNIAGDGSFGMNLSELITLTRHKIPVLQLVMNNGTLGMVRQWQKLFYGGRFSETTLGSPFDYEKLGDAFGIKTFVIEKEKDMGYIAEAAELVRKGEPVLLECRIDTDLNVLPMVPAGKPITDPMMYIDDAPDVT